MSQQKPVLVLVTDKYCGHCIVFKPIWDAQIATDPALKNAFTIQTMPFDQKSGKTLTKPFDFVEGFPTIAIIPANVYATPNASSQAKVFRGDQTKVQTVKDWAMSNAPRGMSVLVSQTPQKNYRSVSNAPW